MDTLCEMHKAAFEEDADRKVYAELRNGIRNDFRHICTGKTLEVNLDDEASEMISRAIDSYKLLFPGFYPRFKEFGEQWLKRHKQKTTA